MPSRPLSMQNPDHAASSFTSEILYSPFSSDKNALFEYTIHPNKPSFMLLHSLPFSPFTEIRKNKKNYNKHTAFKTVRAICTFFNAYRPPKIVPLQSYRIPIHHITTHPVPKLSSTANKYQPHPRIYHPQQQKMDPPTLTLPKPTYNNPSPAPFHTPINNNNNNTTDLEAQPPNSNALLQTTPTMGQNSLRTRLFSGLLLFTVLGVVVVVLVGTSGRGVRRRRGH